MKSYLERAIIHIDGDAFFVSVEQAKDYRLKGRPVVTGGERFIAAAMSYEAKARGVTRGMRLADIKRVCPEVVVLDSDYVTYTIFARRMYNIVRTYTPLVEEYSIDECFADITGMDKILGMSYEEIGKKIKDELEAKLGITFGVGLSSSKVLAKVASKHMKPAGYTVIGSQFGNNGTNRDRVHFLESLAIEKVWGIGSATTKLLRSHQILTALDFAKLTSSQLASLHISKPYREIHQELNGYAVLSVHSEDREAPKSIMCTRTFIPASKNPEEVFSHLSKNIEEACERLRIEGMETQMCSIYFKSQDFRYYRFECHFDRPTSNPVEVISYIKKEAYGLFKSHLTYRASGVSFYKLIPKDYGHPQSLGLFETPYTPNIFESHISHAISHALTEVSAGEIVEPVATLLDRIDLINRKYGEHTMMLGSSLKAVHSYREKVIRKRARKDAGQKLSEYNNRVWEVPVVGTVKG